MEAVTRPAFQLVLSLDGLPLTWQLPRGAALARCQALLRWLRAHVQGNAWQVRLYRLQANGRPCRTALRTWQRRALPTRRPLPDSWPQQLNALFLQTLPPPRSRQPFAWLAEAARHSSVHTHRGGRGTGRSYRSPTGPRAS